eukprot:987215-Amphidinium_carterae.2
MLDANTLSSDELLLSCAIEHHISGRVKRQGNFWVQLKHLDVVHQSFLQPILRWKKDKRMTQRRGGGDNE